MPAATRAPSRRCELLLLPGAAHFAELESSISLSQRKKNQRLARVGRTLKLHLCASSFGVLFQFYCRELRGDKCLEMCPETQTLKREQRFPCSDSGTVLSRRGFCSSATLNQITCLTAASDVTLWHTKRTRGRRRATPQLSACLCPAAFAPFLLTGVCPQRPRSCASNTSRQKASKPEKSTADGRALCRPPPGLRPTCPLLSPPQRPLLSVQMLQCVDDTPVGFGGGLSQCRWHFDPLPPS